MHKNPKRYVEDEVGSGSELKKMIVVLLVFLSIEISAVNAL